MLQPIVLGQRKIEIYRSWRKLPRHPLIDRLGRLNNTGTYINTLHPYKGRVLVGYGDWGTNTGPSSICSVDPLSGEWIIHAESIDTEAVIRFVDMGTETLALHVDPLGYYAWESLTAFTNVGTGKPSGRGPFIHTNHACTLSDGSWWVVGSVWTDQTSTVDSASASRSFDKGDTWEVYVDTNEGTTTSGLRRFSYGAEIDGKPAAYSTYGGWRILGNDGTWSSPSIQPSAPQLVSTPSPTVAPTPPSTVPYITARTVAGNYLAIGTSGGDVWVCPTYSSGLLR